MWAFRHVMHCRKDTLHTACRSLHGQGEHTGMIQTVVFQGSKDLAGSGVRTLRSCFTRTVEVTICIILERLLDRPRQLPHVTSTTVHRDPKAAQGTTKTDYGGADGWQSKSLRNSIWQGKPACWRRPGVQPQLPGLPRHQER